MRKTYTLKSNVDGYMSDFFNDLEELSMASARYTLNYNFLKADQSCIMTVNVRCYKDKSIYRLCKNLGFVWC